MIWRSWAKIRITHRLCMRAELSKPHHQKSFLQILTTRIPMRFYAHCLPTEGQNWKQFRGSRRRLCKTFQDAASIQDAQNVWKYVPKKFQLLIMSELTIILRVFVIKGITVYLENNTNIFRQSYVRSIT